ncbi:MAG TPA: hypothetical protein VLI04_22165 [Nocardioidaceae bacterium]|nr:hypothetical protein [Nocardioidaceae bacterium]
MARRVNLPKADDLFRPTAVPDAPPDIHVVVDDVPAPVGKPKQAKVAPEDEATEKLPSGRVKHDEKMTVYVTSDELLDLEHARLTLRRTLGRSVDRGRLVRAAVALALADLEANGEDSALVQRLTQA